MSSNFIFINNTIDGVDNNLYKISLIQYPGQISSGQFLYIEKYKKYFIQSKIATINYGTLSNENKNNFKASDNIIEISIITEYYDLMNFLLLIPLIKIIFLMNLLELKYWGTLKVYQENILKIN